MAECLGALDDKIELNRRMNQTLETMAQALFRSWFVDFDPVRAKAAGRQPEGMGPETAALFPCRFVDSELGPIPEGWRIMPLGESCAAIFSGGTPSTREQRFWGGKVPWLSSGETRHSFIIETEKTITEEAITGSSTRLARSGSTVIASAGQGHTRGQTSFLAFDSYINQSVVAVVADPAVSSDLFVFHDLARRYEQFRRLSDSHSSRGSLTTKLLADLKVIIPPRDLITAFDRATEPLVEQNISNLRQSVTISRLRDLLLPKLLSGEIRVREAEAQLAATA
ncbi:type I restriction endonuclease subunit S [Corallococcus macrosporus DSM 14697]|uniref:Type I restriction endonuclease subunit S n=2 Tax=Corallococcus macrosporus TaxID=35 RepID=A0A250JWM6_9BACT|nr:type I restriction endonuclease subunit S [Corallococcus macrosporus DSM 14697]